jgi:hypothetical protein
VVAEAYLVAHSTDLAANQRQLIAQLTLWWRDRQTRQTRSSSSSNKRGSGASFEG